MRPDGHQQPLDLKDSDNEDPDKDNTRPLKCAFPCSLYLKLLLFHIDCIRFGQSIHDPISNLMVKVKAILKNDF